jgi:DNA-directed RNA polymerase specialized sigma24 family protein
MKPRREGRCSQHIPRQDRNALRFVLVWSGVIRKILRSAGVPSGDIDDCTQEVLVRAWAAWKRGHLDTRRAAAVRAWAQIAATRFGAAWAKARKRTPFVEDVRDVEEPLVDGAEGPALARDLLRELRASTTPERWRAWLASAEGDTMAEIAAAEGVAICTVSTRIMLARRDFVAALRRERARERTPVVRSRRKTRR